MLLVAESATMLVIKPLFLDCQEMNWKGQGGFRRYLVITYQTVPTLLFVKNIGPVVMKKFCLMAGIGQIPPVCVSLCA